MNIKMNSGKVIIDGKEFKGNSFSIVGNKVIVDGVTQDGELIGDVNIEVFGDVEKIENTSGAVNVNGFVTNAKTVSGNITVAKDIRGDVQTVSGHIKSNVIHGNCKSVSGNIIK